MPFQPKFYYAENSNRTIVSGKLGFNFEPFERFAGTWRGLYAAKSEAEAAALDLLTADPRSAVIELTEEEYRKKKKSSATSFESYTPLPGAGSTGDQRIVPGTAVLVQNPGPENVPEPKPVVTGEAVEGVEGALVVGKVKGKGAK